MIGRCVAKEVELPILEAGAADALQECGQGIGVDVARRCIAPAVTTVALSRILSAESIAANPLLGEVVY